jgi:lysophospholipid acyltransferase 7
LSNIILSTKFKNGFKRRLPYYSFLITFGYLIFFRKIKLFTDHLDEPGAFTNAVQLILTLKLVGLAFEVHDSTKRIIDKEKLDAKQSIVSADLRIKKLHNKLIETVTTSSETALTNTFEKDEQNKINDEINKLELIIKYSSINMKPTFLDLFNYSYCYIGIFTGPYYKYRTYLDWLSFDDSKNEIDSIKTIIQRVKLMPIFILAFVFLNSFIDFKEPINNASFYENSTFLYRIFYMFLTFTMFRFRFYIAWELAEAACMSSSLGAYPIVCKAKPGAGPTDFSQFEIVSNNESKNNLKYNFNAIYNIDEIGTETCLTVKNALHGWNKTVQYWMATNIYHRVPNNRIAG